MNDVQKIKKWVNDHPTASFSEAKSALNLKCSDVTYYKYRKQFVTGKVDGGEKSKSLASENFRPRGAAAETYKVMQDVLKHDPEIKYSEFKRRYGAPITNNTFSRYRDAIINGKGAKGAVEKAVAAAKKRKNVYMSVFTAPSESLPAGAKALLRDFISCLNSANKTSMELVEYADPKMIEVRDRA